MHAEQKRFLQERYEFRKWQAPRKSGRRVVTGLDLEALNIRGWTLERAKLEDQATVRTIHSLWRRAEAQDELLSIDLFECESSKGAHNQLLEVLGNVESGAVERRTGTNDPGEVAFGLEDTMALFARGNVVVMVRNAGPRIVPVTGVARQLDSLVMRLAGSKR